MPRWTVRRYSDSDLSFISPYGLEAADNQWWLMIKVPKALALSQANTISQNWAALLVDAQRSRWSRSLSSFGGAGLTGLVHPDHHSAPLISRHVSHLSSNEGDLTQQMRSTPTRS